MFARVFVDDCEAGIRIPWQRGKDFYFYCRPVRPICNIKNLGQGTIRVLDRWYLHSNLPLDLKNIFSSFDTDTYLVSQK